MRGVGTGHHGGAGDDPEHGVGVSELPDAEALAQVGVEVDTGRPPSLLRDVASPNVSPTPRRRATLASLADELKVSRTTISNAFNRPDQLSADLRERVLETAKRLGYPGPDPVARSLRTRKAGAVGLMITEPL